MADTNFTSGMVVPLPWIQDVNNAVYRALGAGGKAPTTPAQTLANIGAAPVSGSSTQVFSVATATSATQATPLAQVQSLITGSVAGVSSFNTRTGAVTLSSNDVVTALGYTPANGAAGVYSFNSRTGAVTLTSTDVTTALGYSPQNTVIESIATLRTATSATLPTTTTIVSSYYGDERGGGGVYAINTSDTTSSDNSGTVIVDASGRRWYLQHNGEVSIKQFGAKIDDTTDDASVINAAILVASSQAFTLTAPDGVSVCTTTISFPASLIDGFSFKAASNWVIKYTGSGDAVSVDALFRASLVFGKIICTAIAANGIHFYPTTPGPADPTHPTLEFCYIRFNTIWGAVNSLYCDTSLGNVAQLVVEGMEISNSSGVAITSGTSRGIYLNGSGSSVCQGCQFNLNYINAGPSMGSGATWIGIQDSRPGTYNNVNTYTFGALDGMLLGTSSGIEVASMQNAFYGPIVDMMADGVIFDSGSSGNYVEASVIGARTTIIVNNSTSTDNLVLATGNGGFILNGPSGGSVTVSAINVALAAVASGAMNLELANSTYLAAKSNSGTALNILYVNTGNELVLGTSAVGVTVPVPFYILNSAQAQTMTVTGVTPGSSDSHTTVTFGGSYSGSATGGTASALPSLPHGYLEFNAGGTVYKLPFYGA